MDLVQYAVTESGAELIPMTIDLLPGVSAAQTSPSEEGTKMFKFDKFSCVIGDLLYRSKGVKLRECRLFEKVSSDSGAFVVKTFNRNVLQSQKHYTNDEREGGGSGLKVSTEWSRRALNELGVMLKIAEKGAQHVNIVSMHHHFQSEESGNLHLLLDRCEPEPVMIWRDLSYICPRTEQVLDLERAVAVSADIASGLSYR
jgi:hypothetical protein